MKIPDLPPSQTLGSTEENFSSLEMGGFIVIYSLLSQGLLLEHPRQWRNPGSSVDLSSVDPLARGRSRLTGLDKLGLQEEKAEILQEWTQAISLGQPHQPLPQSLPATLAQSTEL